MWRVIIGPHGTPLVLPFFNMNLTERPIAIFLQSKGINAKQKSVGINAKTWSKCRDQWHI